MLTPARFAQAGLVALALLAVSGCDQLTKSSTPAPAASAPDTTSEKQDLDRKIADKKAEFDQLTADIPNLTDDQAKIDAVNKQDALRREIDDLVEQRGRL